MMQKVIPCERCEEEKRRLELGGVWKVVSCEPLKDDSSKCVLIYKKDINSEEDETP